MYHQKKKAAQLRWTLIWRRNHKKSKADTVAKKKAKKTENAARPFTPAAFAEDASLDALPDNWNDARPCPLCGLLDSIYHIVALCRHWRMAAARAAMINDARVKLIPGLVRDLRAARLHPSDGGPPLPLDLSPEQEAALEHRAIFSAGLAIPAEAGHALYRLATGAPWPRQAAQPLHHFNAAMGATFDAVAASRHDMRDLATRWLNWAERTLLALAKARRKAMADEAAAPSPMPLAPWAGPPPSALPPQPLGGVAPWTYPPLMHTDPPAYGCPGPPDAFVPATWFKHCNLAALRHLVHCAHTSLELRATVTAALPTPGNRNKKAWHHRILSHLRIRYRDLPSLLRLAPPHPPYLPTIPQRPHPPATVGATA